MYKTTDVMNIIKFVQWSSLCIAVQCSGYSAMIISICFYYDVLRFDHVMMK